MNEQFLNSIAVHPTYDFSHLRDKPYVIFWGGVDISPQLYGEQPSPYTQHADIRRDLLEVAMAKYCVKHSIPMIGICRGAQLLNVFNGGTLNQDITNHTYSHIMKTYDGREIRVNSTHHQMMLPGPNAHLLGTANHPCKGYINGAHHDLSFTYEVIAYPDTKSLCIQYHPEWLPEDSEAVLFAKEMAEKYLGLNDVKFRDDSQWYGDI